MIAVKFLKGTNILKELRLELQISRNDLVGFLTVWLCFEMMRRMVGAPYEARGSEGWWKGKPYGALCGAFIWLSGPLPSGGMFLFYFLNFLLK